MFILRIYIVQLLKKYSGILNATKLHLAFVNFGSMVFQEKTPFLHSNRCIEDEKSGCRVFGEHPGHPIPPGLPVTPPKTTRSVSHDTI